MYCSKCGNKFESQDKFCSKCGTSVNKDICNYDKCPNCGLERKKEISFCQNCGFDYGYSKSSIESHSVSKTIPSAKPSYKWVIILIVSIQFAVVFFQILLSIIFNY